MKVEILEASPVEWGLIINGEPQRTWWKSDFPEGKPADDHPLVLEAIDAWRENQRLFQQ
jgi:hypothetical protein